MAVTTIKLGFPIRIKSEATDQELVVETLDLRDLEAGDIFDAGREQPSGATQAELETRVAALCAGQPFAILRRLRGADLGKLQLWWNDQWKLPTTKAVEEEDGDGGDEPDADPSKAGGTSPAS